MTNPKTFKCEGIILKTRPFGERDRLISFFSPTLGRHQAIVKTRSPIEPLTHRSMELYKGKTLDLLTESHLISAFAGIRESFNALSMGGYFCDIIVKSTADGQPNMALFEILKSSLTALDAHHPVTIVCDAFHRSVLMCEGLCEAVEERVSPSRFLKLFGEYCGKPLCGPVLL